MVSSYSKTFSIFTSIGNTVIAVLAAIISLLNFIGETLLSLCRWITFRTQMRSRDLIMQLDRLGPRSLFIIALVSLLIGIATAVIAGEILVRFRATKYIANVVTVAMMQQIGPLLVGLIMTLRGAGVFAVELGTMKFNKELDVLSSNTISIYDYLILPRLFAISVTMPLLFVFAMGFGMIGGYYVGTWGFHIPPVRYIAQSEAAFSISHMLIGFIKIFCFAIIIAIGGCYSGIKYKANLAAVGKAVLSTVTICILYIVLADTCIEIIFSTMGY